MQKIKIISLKIAVIYFLALIVYTQSICASDAFPIYKSAIQNNSYFDKVALKNDKRWAFNYLLWNDSFISNLFNLTPVFYALEMKEQTYQQVNNSVRNTIDITN